MKALFFAVLLVGFTQISSAKDISCEINNDQLTSDELKFLDSEKIQIEDPEQIQMLMSMIPSFSYSSKSETLNLVLSGSELDLNCQHVDMPEGAPLAGAPLLKTNCSLEGADPDAVVLTHSFFGWNYVTLELNQIIPDFPFSIVMTSCEIK